MYRFHKSQCSSDFLGVEHIQLKILLIRKLMKVMDIFITLVLVLAPQMHAHVQTNQTVYIKYIQFFVSQLYLNQAVK